jgi:uncharacterized membrane protein YbhN (UPF0104 family)
MSGSSKDELAPVILESLPQGKLRSENFHKLLVILKVLLGLALLYLSVRGIHSTQLLGLGLKFWRWVLLVRNYHLPLSTSRLFAAYFTGQAANILLPFRGGELIRLGYFATHKETLPQAASTIVLEKYLDLSALTLLCLLVSYRVALANLLDLRAILLPATIGVTILLFLVVLTGPAIWERVRGYSLIPRLLVSWLDRWVQASGWLKQPGQVLPALLITLIIWVVMWLTNLLLFTSLGLALGGEAAGLVLVLVYIGLLPALMPGNIGPFYFFASLAVLPFGVIPSQALVFAVLLHAIVTLPPLLGGAAGLFLHSSRIASP